MRKRQVVVGLGLGLVASMGLAPGIAAADKPSDSPNGEGQRFIVQYESGSAPAKAIDASRTGVNPVSDEDLTADAAATIIDSVAPSVHIEKPTRKGARLTADEGRVAFAEDGQGVLALTDAQHQHVEVSMPEKLVGDAEVAEDGTIFYRGEDDSSLAVQAMLEGGVRLINLIESAHAPSRYAFTFTDQVLSLQPDGSVILSDSSGGPSGVISAPWAKDATGKDVPTWYEIDGDTLWQVVDLSQGGYQFPIAADPWWNPFSWDWRKIGRATATGLKKCGIGALGGTGGAVGANVAVNLVRNAAGKYLISIYGGPFGLLSIAAAGCVTNIIS